MEGSPVRHQFIAATIAALVLALPVKADVVKLHENAPETYVVVKGDTLWDISGRFLKDPWRWPTVWNLNRDEIKNPHLIYPGDMIVLDRSGSSPRLRLVKGTKNGMTTVKLSPGSRAIELGGDAIQTIPARAIYPFLAQPRVVAEGALSSAPFILGTNDDRVVLSTGDDAFATGGKAFAIYHARGEKLPDGTYVFDHSRIAYLFDPDGKPIALLPIDQGADAVAGELVKWVR